jgi:polar amino acid transport system substrate-binding protein
MAMVKKHSMWTKKALCLALSFLALPLTFPQAVRAKDQATVRIATAGDYPPFNYMDSKGQVQGFEIDIMRIFCAEVNLKCEFFVQDWSGLIPALVSGKYDALVSSISITESRKKEVAFSHRFYDIPIGIVVSKNANIQDVTPEAFKGKRIGVQASTVHAAYAEDIYEPAGATVRLYRSLDDANFDLKSGRIDAVLADKIVLDLWLKKDGAECCRDLGIVKSKKYFGDGAGIAFRKNDIELRDLFNKAIVLSRQNGSYQKISQEYFGHDVYESHE